MRQHHRPVDTSVEVSGRHDFAVRLSAHSSLAGQASTASPAPRFVTIAKRPSCGQKTRGNMPVICPTSQAKRSAANWHDGQITRRRIPEHWSQEPRREPVIQCGRCTSASARIPDSRPTSREVRKVTGAQVARLHAKRQRLGRLKAQVFWKVCSVGKYNPKRRRTKDAPHHTYCEKQPVEV
jgi:hypothetical protein